MDQDTPQLPGYQDICKPVLDSEILPFCFNSSICDDRTMVELIKWAPINTRLTADRDAHVNKDQTQREVKDTKNKL